MTYDTAVHLLILPIIENGNTCIWYYFFKHTCAFEMLNENKLIDSKILCIYFVYSLDLGKYVLRKCFPNMIYPF